MKLKEKTGGKQRKLEIWLVGGRYHRNWHVNLAEWDFCATADNLNGIQVWIWEQKASRMERSHIWQLERYLQKFSSCQDSKVETSPEFHQTSLILAGILNLFLPVCCYSFSRKRTTWWIFLRPLWGSDETCGVTLWVWEYCGIHRSCWLHGIYNRMKIDVLALRFALRHRWQVLPSATQVAYLLAPLVCCCGVLVPTYKPTLLLFFPLFLRSNIVTGCWQFLFLFFF